MTVVAAGLALALVVAVVLWVRARAAARAAALVSARYEALAAHLPDVSVLLYDRELRFTLLEGAALQAHGWRREDFEGRLISDVTPPDRPRRARARGTASP